MRPRVIVDGREIKVGSIVVLKANAEEGWPEERARVIEIQRYVKGGADMMTLEHEDGNDLFEASADQVKEVVK